MLDSGSPVSAISPSVGRLLQRAGVLQQAADPRYVRLSRLRAIDASDTMLPDVDVRLLPRLDRLQIDGLLGLDFFRQFRRVCFEVSAARLVLE